MVFTSITFLFAFLPLVLLLDALAPPKTRNAVVLAASLLFYAWGEGPYVLLLFALFLGNALAAPLVARARSTSRVLVLAIVVAGNLVPLLVLKYTNFALTSVYNLLGAVGAAPHEPWHLRLHLPLGISFFTFQAISYQTDLWRNNEEAPARTEQLGVYLFMFPQLVAGPIVRFQDVARELVHRTSSVLDRHEGLARFVQGLGKKVLIADVLATAADPVFGAPEALSPQTAAIGLAAYSLQIYFDFSGYSDMAIGLGRMLGFSLPENFRHPYAARSVTDFWRRWHITLSSWFRDYVYVPMGGSRLGRLRTFVNLWIVFLLCGLWHGAAFNFIVWGAVHGAALSVERIFRERASLPRFLVIPLGHVWTLAVVSAAWVLFRSESLHSAGTFFASLCGTGPPHEAKSFAFGTKVETTLVLGAVLSIGPLRFFAKFRAVLRPLAVPALVLVFVASLARVIATTHSPFIYFRF